MLTAKKKPPGEKAAKGNKQHGICTVTIVVNFASKNISKLLP